MEDSENKTLPMKNDLKETWNKIPTSIKTFFIVCSIVAIFTGAAKLFGQRPTEYKKDFVDSIIKIVRALQEQQKLANQEKDTDPLGALQKINQAQGALIALKMLLSESEIMKITGFNIPKLTRALEDLKVQLLQSFVVDGAAPIKSQFNHDDDE